MKKLVIIVFAFLSLPAIAWQPNKPIEAIIGFAPGSVNEILMRSLAQEVEKNTNAKFIIINKPGAGGVVGSEYFSRKPNDGHHVMMVSLTGLTAMDMVAVPDPTKGRSYTIDSFSYILGVATTGFAIVANANDPVNSVDDLIKHVRESSITVGSSGGSRMVYETLNLRFPNNRMAHVAYGSPAQQIIDVAGGNLRFGVVPSAAVAGFLSGPDKNRIKVVAVTSAKSLQQWPLVQPLAVIHQDLVIAAEWGLILPAKVDASVQAWYAKEFRRALQSESVKNVFNQNLLTIMPNTLDSRSFREFVAAETKKNHAVVNAILQSQIQK